MSNLIVPVISWSQRREFVNINVEITDAKNVRVSFSNPESTGLVQVNATNSDEKENELKLELFNQIRAELCKYKVTGRKIELRIEKLADDVEFWPRLTKSKEKNRNITIDWSRWVEDDEDEQDEQGDDEDDDQSNWNYQNQFENNQSLDEQEEEDEDEEDDEEEEKIHDGEYVWYEGLEGRELYQHFIDSYRLRVEDDYSHRGKLRGLYAQESPLDDFKKYISKAKNRNLFPSSWNDTNEQELIDMALNDDWANINYAVEKHDIQDKYNALAPLELRALAELVMDKKV